MNDEPIPHFFLRVLNGCSSGAFGIQVLLGSSSGPELFERFTTDQYDHRIDVFKRFVTLENGGKLTFDWEVLSSEYHIDKCVAGRQDCRPWMNELDSRRINKKDKT